MDTIRRGELVRLNKPRTSNSHKKRHLLKRAQAKVRKSMAEFREQVLRGELEGL